MVGECNTFDDDALTVLNSRDVTSTAKDDGGVIGAIVYHNLDGLNTRARFNAHALDFATDFYVLTWGNRANLGEVETFKTINKTFSVDFAVVCS